MGLIQEVVPDGQALERALTLAAVMADYPWASLVNDRRAAYEGLALGLAEGIAREMDLHAADLMDEEMHDGLERFIEGQWPQPPLSPA
jgi:enoyl-CoA hydratase/carnithine racemase